MPNICLLGRKHFPQQTQGHRRSQPNPRLLQALGVRDSCTRALQHPLFHKDPLPLWCGSTEPRGSQPLLTLSLSLTLTSGHLLLPLPPKGPQDSQGKAARLNMELELPKAGFPITLSLSCPHAELPVDTELLNKAISCQGCPKSGQPAFSTLPCKV